MTNQTPKVTRDVSILDRIADLTFERDALRAQVAALTPTDVQAKRSELANIALAACEARYIWVRSSFGSREQKTSFLAMIKAESDFAALKAAEGQL